MKCLRGIGAGGGTTRLVGLGRGSGGFWALGPLPVPFLLIPFIRFGLEKCESAFPLRVKTWRTWVRAALYSWRDTTRLPTPVPSVMVIGVGGRVVSRPLTRLLRRKSGSGSSVARRYLLRLTKVLECPPGTTRAHLLNPVFSFIRSLYPCL